MQEFILIRFSCNLDTIIPTTVLFEPMTPCKTNSSKIHATCHYTDTQKKTDRVLRKTLARGLKFAT